MVAEGAATFAQVSGRSAVVLRVEVGAEGTQRGGSRRGVALRLASSKARVAAEEMGAVGRMARTFAASCQDVHRASHKEDSSP